MTVKVRTLRGDQIVPHLAALADLRITVFRDWPYLYDGDAAYEREYLSVYRREGAVVVGAFDGVRMIGAATAAPMAQHADGFSDAFRPEEIEQTYYFAESVLLSDYRGQGIGHRFFDIREEEGRRLGFRRAAFCSVLRPEDHPLRPDGPRSHEAFWRGRGYAPLPGVIARFTWQDVGQLEESEKALQFWGRAL